VAAAEGLCQVVLGGAAVVSFFLGGGEGRGAVGVTLGFLLVVGVALVGRAFGCFPNFQTQPPPPKRLPNDEKQELPSDHPIRTSFDADKQKRATHHALSAPRLAAAGALPVQLPYRERLDDELPTPIKRWGVPAWLKVPGWLWASSREQRSGGLPRRKRAGRRRWGLGLGAPGQDAGAVRGGGGRGSVGDGPALVFRSQAWEFEVDPWDGAWVGLKDAVGGGGGGWMELAWGGRG